MYNNATDYKAFTGKSALMASVKNRPFGVLFFGGNTGTLCDMFREGEMKFDPSPFGSG